MVYFGRGPHPFLSSSYLPQLTSPISLYWQAILATEREEEKEVTKVLGPKTTAKKSVDLFQYISSIVYRGEQPVSCCPLHVSSYPALIGRQSIKVAISQAVLFYLSAIELIRSIKPLMCQFTGYHQASHDMLSVKAVYYRNGS